MFRVLEQELKANLPSSNLWVQSLDHQKAVAKENGDSEADWLSYERMVSNCGCEWHSDKLWDPVSNLGAC